MNNIHKHLVILTICFALIGCNKFALLNKECGLRAAAECYKLTSECIHSDTQTKIKAPLPSPTEDASINEGKE
jgi:hypothetical protein